MEAAEFYNAAMYLRLSRDDLDGSKAESDSISSQREMIRSYVRKQDNMEIYDIYVDDGYSGTNFDRPGLKRMMKDIEAGNVNCVIVKDLSRLGRDYIEAGRLIQKTFPAFCVRFIALTDHFDSLTADADETALIVPVRNFVNDSYAQDISAKVRSQKKLRRERGEFIGSFAVYGYQKSSENRNRLIPDPYAAGIVKRIFAWKLEGYSCLAIARRLEEMGVLSPMEYKKMRGERYQTTFAAGARTGWSSVAVRRILTNECYTGTLVQGKADKINYKVNKIVKKPEEEWIKVPGTHAAVVSREDFETVQDLLRVDVRAGAGEKKAHLYAGLLFCGDCRQPMTRRVNRKHGKETAVFVCGRKNADGDCSRHRIPEEDLNMVLLTLLRQQTALFLDQDSVLAELKRMRVPFEETAVFGAQIKRLRQEQDNYLQLRAGLSADLEQKIITEEDYTNYSRIFEKRCDELQQAAERQEETRKRLFQSGAAAGIDLERMKRGFEITALDRTTLITFVKHIFVYEDCRIHVTVRYNGLSAGLHMTEGESDNGRRCEEGVH